MACPPADAEAVAAAAIAGAAAIVQLAGRMDERPIAILGAGMAGFGAAHRLSQERVRPVLYEAGPRIGGHTATHAHPDGFAFDEGPHVSFTANERLQALFAQAVGGRFERIQAYVDNHWRGHWFKHPVQVNLHGLPADLVARCIADFVAASRTPAPPPANYERWLRAALGDTIAEVFPMQYARKYHTTEAANLTTDWLGPRIYRPTVEEVLRGAREAEPLDVHYVDRFRYPTEGGFGAYLAPLRDLADCRCGHRVAAIDPVAKVLTFADGTAAAYGALVSSIPLPLLVPMIRGAPADVLTAARRLAWSQVVLVNVGLDRPVETRAHWTYVYDEEMPFARLSYPARMSPRMAPDGAGSIQAEIYFSEKWKPMRLAPADLVAPTIDGLLRCGLIRDRAHVVHASTILAPFANVIFDHDRGAALAVVNGYLDDVAIARCGRYGDWGHHWTDEAFESGERAASQALDRLAARR